MEHSHVVKVLNLLDNTPKIFELDEKTFLSGLTITELLAVKKYFEPTVLTWTPTDTSRTFQAV